MTSQTNTIYDQHDAAFANVSAYVVLDDKHYKVATVALKFPKDGAGRLYAYVHWLGAEMRRGFAGGYGYDKRSAAVADACKRIDDPDAEAFTKALSSDNGQDWTQKLEAAGFVVLQAV